MKKTGILHPEIAHLIADLGHTDYIVLADKGYPVPQQTRRINVGITDDIPTIPQLLSVIESEMSFDRIIITEEMQGFSQERYQELKQTYPTIKFEEVTHQDMKALTGEAAGVIKTGDTCAYANMIIVSG